MHNLFIDNCCLSKYMTISGRQKHGLENWIRDILTDLLATFGIEIEHITKEMKQTGDWDAIQSINHVLNKKISEEVTSHTNNIVHLVLDNPENHGPVGMIRGYIRMIRDYYSDVDPDTRQRAPYVGHEARFTTLQEILSTTKLVMNGENVLSQPICKYEDKEEQEEGKNYYCLKVIGYGFEYCYDHWQIVRISEAAEKNSELAKTE